MRADPVPGSTGELGRDGCSFAKITQDFGKLASDRVEYIVRRAKEVAYLDSRYLALIVRCGSRDSELERR
jgi:hypothetical protein